MSYPTSSKHAMKSAKPVARYFLKHESAWRAHRVRECLNHCWYCGMEKVFRRSALDELTKQAQELKMGYEDAKNES